MLLIYQQVGAVLDEPVGRNDGTFRSGTRYFECEPNYGVFTRGANVQCGDFPVRDLMEESDEEHEHDDGHKCNSDDDEI